MLPPASWKDAANGSDSDSFQLAAPLLELRVCENLDSTSKGRVCVFYHSVALLCADPAGLQSQMFRGLLLPVQDPWAGETDPGFKTLPPWGELVQL